MSDQMEVRLQRMTTPPEESEPFTVIGRLEMVDLRDRKLRIADDVGNRIMLEDVANAEAVSDLVGKRALASGAPTHDMSGRLLSIAAPTIEPAPVPAQWQNHTDPTTWSLPDTATSPDPDGGANFDDEEWADLLSAVNGA